MSEISKRSEFGLEGDPMQRERRNQRHYKYLIILEVVIIFGLLIGCRYSPL
jgi:hypothetical protein